MSGKRQQTMAKMNRERAVRERRALKLEKKQAAAAARKAAAEGRPLEGEGATPEAWLEGSTAVSSPHDAQARPEPAPLTHEEPAPSGPSTR